MDLSAKQRAIDKCRIKQFAKFDVVCLQLLVRLLRLLLYAELWSIGHARQSRTIWHLTDGDKVNGDIGTRNKRSMRAHALACVSKVDVLYEYHTIHWAVSPRQFQTIWLQLVDLCERRIRLQIPNYTKTYSENSFEIEWVDFVRHSLRRRNKLAQTQLEWFRNDRCVCCQQNMCASRCAVKSKTKIN